MAKLNLVVGFTRLSEQRCVFTPLGAAGTTMPDLSEVVSSEI